MNKKEKVKTAPKQKENDVENYSDSLQDSESMSDEDDIFIHSSDAELEEEGKPNQQKKKFDKNTYHFIY